MLTEISLDDAFELAIGCSTDDYEFVADELYDQGRWTTLTFVTFRADELYQFIWESPSTEYQEGSEDNEDPMPVYHVQPVQTTVYRKVKP